jgi:hypothetical protein
MIGAMVGEHFAPAELANEFVPYAINATLLKELRKPTI